MTYSPQIKTINKWNILLLVTGLLSSAILKKLSDDAYEVKEHSLSIDLKEHSR